MFRTNVVAKIETHTLVRFPENHAVY